jgi:hypothetical protein
MIAVVFLYGGYEKRKTFLMLGSSLGGLNGRWRAEDVLTIWVDRLEVVSWRLI